MAEKKLPAREKLAEFLARSKEPARLACKEVIINIIPGFEQVPVLILLLAVNSEEISLIAGC